VDAVPGLVEEVAVTGSALTGDWHPGASDIDLVVVVRRRVTAADAEILTGLLGHLARAVRRSAAAAR